MLPHKDKEARPGASPLLCTSTRAGHQHPPRNHSQRNTTKTVHCPKKRNYKNTTALSARRKAPPNAHQKVDCRLGSGAAPPAASGRLDNRSHRRCGVRPVVPHLGRIPARPTPKVPTGRTPSSPPANARLGRLPRRFPRRRLGTRFALALDFLGGPAARTARGARRVGNCVGGCIRRSRCSRRRQAVDTIVVVAKGPRRRRRTGFALSLALAGR
eukprot:TRINITY_DN1018_c0_g1_i10.p1 TRINITY_DN1018_c0_g1~~TRINITY_DN1018_c0_g1_i10.p1  ORF type:complete len:214 (-),score=16.41 TRINITY_DN1018_c0_g1_i10:405-1046(-)